MEMLEIPFDEFSYGFVDVGRWNVNDVLAAAETRDAMPSMTEDVGESLEAEVDVREIANALDDERPRLREENVRQSGTVRPDDNDCRIEQFHYVVERRHWIVTKHRQLQTGIVGCYPYKMYI